MFSFNGTFRSRPEQSLGGASKKEARDELVRRAAEDRLKRNHFKRNTHSATKIQACFRSHKCRSDKKRQERVSFDQLQASSHTPTTTLASIQTLARKLNFFFDPSNEQDALRLVFLSQLIIKNKNEIISLIITSGKIGDEDDNDDGGDDNDDRIFASSLHYFIKKLLRYNCRLICKSHKQPAIPVRFIEVFTSRNSYTEAFKLRELNKKTNNNPTTTTTTTADATKNNITHTNTTTTNDTTTTTHDNTKSTSSTTTTTKHSYTTNCSINNNNVQASNQTHSKAIPNVSSVDSHTLKSINRVVTSVKKYILQNGYFPTIIFLTNQRIPSSISQSDDITRISMATTIRDMILRFVIITSEKDNDDDDDEEEDEDYKRELMSRLTSDVLCIALSVQKSEFLLPTLTTPLFPYSSLLRYLTQQFNNTSTHSPHTATTNNQLHTISNTAVITSNNPSTSHKTNISANNNNNNLKLFVATTPTTPPPSTTTTTTTATITDATTTDSSNLFLLHSLIEMASPHFGTFKSKDFNNFLTIVSHLSTSLEPSTFSRQHGLGEEEEEEEDGGIMNNAMEWSAEASHSSQLEQLKQRCIELLGNSSTLASSLLAPLSNDCLDDNSLISLCRICYAVLHFGRSKMTALKTKIFNSIAFNCSFLEHTWSIISSIHTTNILNEPAPLLQLVSRGVSLCRQDLQVFIPLLSVFSNTFNHFLLTVSDAEFHGRSGSSGLKLFSDLATVSKVALSLRDCCLGIIELTHPESKFSIKKTYPHQQHHQAFSFSSSPSSSDADAQFAKRQRMLTQAFKDAVKLVKQLYDRDCRQSFCPPNCWLASNHIIQSDKLVQSLSDSAIECIGSPFGTLSILNSDNPDLREDAPQLSNSEVRKLIVLSELPFIIPFVNRVEIFHDLVRRERLDEPMDSLVSTSVIMIRRNFLYEDAFEKLSYENEPNLKKRLKIRLINAAGLDEAGVDGGGLFREFMGELVKAGFDPNRGFFRTTSDKLHYPNPQSKVLYPDDYLQHFYFLGRILGKVIYEEMLIEVPFASFFLCKLLSRADLDIHHLASLDPLMHRNLLFIKDFNGDVSDLQLNFTATCDNLGVVASDELKPGGENIHVNNHNRFEYVHLMADYRLNKQIKQHCQAFRRGLGEVVPMEWLQLFDHKELQVLLSGADTPIDVDDLRMNTVYSGGYTKDHPVIQMFWQVVGEFTNVQRQMLLKFVTSCSRAPLLGFKELYPAFCIHMAGQDLDRLPTSSTCMNLLKLPEFPDATVLQAKLIYALESGSGFELS